MVFVSGPRQCGKTTLAENILNTKKNGIYLNWDSSKDKKIILNGGWDENADLIVFDEIHKYSRWKNLIKGFYDTLKKKHQFLITGSALLNVYKKGQDSMLGRYHHWRLHPFCLAENPLKMDSAMTMNQLLELGGFPEPLLSGSKIEALRWSKEHMNLIIKQDLRDLTMVRDLDLLSLFYDQLRSRVGSTVSLNNIAGDLGIPSKTLKQWLAILESVYLVFSIKPYSGKLNRTLQKQPKIYVFNNPEVDGDVGAVFENLVATHLIKRLHFYEDSMGEDYELRYIRDREHHEVDFVILKNKKPICLIEVKWDDSNPSKNLNYFGEKLKIEKRIQLVGKLSKSKKINNIEIYPAAEWLSQSLFEEVF
ncbi:MAG: ATP-binding protein [Bdellovibrio sp.]|nr:ATP-binding protein [Bdellovibrio sp.]